MLKRVLLGIAIVTAVLGFFAIPNNPQDGDGTPTVTPTGTELPESPFGASPTEASPFGISPTASPLAVPPTGPSPFATTTPAAGAGASPTPGSSPTTGPGGSVATPAPGDVGSETAMTGPPALAGLWGLIPLGVSALMLRRLRRPSRRSESDN